MEIISVGLPSTCWTACRAAHHGTAAFARSSSIVRRPVPWSRSPRSMPIVHRVATAILLAVGSLAGAQSSAATGAWKCDRAEAEALKQAPLGATRVAKDQLRIRWARGTSTFRDSGVVAGDEGGT